MAFIDVQNDVTSILNRRDMTTTQLLKFLDYGAKRINREIRCPAQEITVGHTFDGTEVYPGRLLVPGDLLQVISIFLNDSADQRTLIKREKATVLVAAQTVGTPNYYYREGATFILGPTPPLTRQVFVSYYQDAAGLVLNADANWLTDTSPDLWVYAALTYASDFFMDERADKWESRFNQIAQDLTNMANDDELHDASIGATYTTDPTEYYPYV